MSEQSFFTLEEDQNETTSNPTTRNNTTTFVVNNFNNVDNSSSNNKLVTKDTSPAVVMLTGDAEQNAVDSSSNVEFGFDVNVLDFIGHSELHEDDDAIISFLANANDNTKCTVTTLDSPESGIDSMISNPDDSSETIKDDNAGAAEKTTTKREPTPSPPPIIDAVKIPNYAQLVQFVTKTWRQVQNEMKQGLVVQF